MPSSIQTLLAKRLDALRLTEPAAPVVTPVLLQAPDNQTALVLAESLRPHWEAFAAAWSAPALKASWIQADSREDQQAVVDVFVSVLPPGLSAAVLPYAPPSDAFGPWVALWADRRHAEPVALTEELRLQWAQALVSGPSALRLFWSALRKDGQEVDAREDRLLGQALGAMLAPRLLWALETDVLHRRLFSWNRLRHWDRPYARMLLDTKPKHWLSLCQRTARELTPHLKRALPSVTLAPDQFFPALAVALESHALVELRSQEPGPMEALERWLGDSLELALPDLLEDPLCIPETRRLVRESLVMDRHVQPLVPPPLLGASLG